MSPLKYISFCLLFILLFSTRGYAQKGVINTSKTKLRQCADLRCKTLATLNKGAIYPILDVGKSETLDSYGNHPWLKIKAGKMVGYVFGGLVDIKNNPVNEIMLSQTAYIREENVNIRACGGGFKDCKVIFQLDKGTYCQLISKTKTETTVKGMGTHPWYFIQAGQKKGYIFGGLLTIAENQLTIDSAKVKVYDYPSEVNGQVINYVVKGDQFDIKSQSAKSEVIRPYGRNYWYEIEKSGQVIGWVYGTYTSKSASAATDCQCVDYVKNLIGVTGPTKNATDWEEVLYGKIPVTLKGQIDSLNYAEITEITEVRRGDIAIFDKLHSEVDDQFGHIGTVHKIAKANGVIGKEIIIEGGNHTVPLAEYYTQKKCNNVSLKKYILDDNVRFYRPIARTY